MAIGWLKGRCFSHPAAGTFAACWVAAAVWLLLAGHGVEVAKGAGAAVGVLVFSAVTVRLTEDPPKIAARGLREAIFLWVQLLLLAGVLLLTAWTGLYSNGATGPPPQLPVWTDAVDWLGQLGERHLDPAWVGSPYHALANPARYFLLPLVFLVPLTGFRYLGLGRGHRVVRVTTLWCAIPAAFLGYFLLTGAMTLIGLAQRLVHNTLVNGPFEEFLCRGAIQTRLTVLLGPRWGVVLSSLAFGVWHVGLGFATTGGQSVADGLASTVLSQATLGLAFAMIYHRTRNLVSSSVCHVIFNSLA